MSLHTTRDKCKQLRNELDTALQALGTKMGMSIKTEGTMRYDETTIHAKIVASLPSSTGEIESPLDTLAISIARVLVKFGTAYADYTEWRTVKDDLLAAHPHLTEFAATKVGYACNEFNEELAKLTPPKKPGKPGKKTNRYP